MTTAFWHRFKVELSLLGVAGADVTPDILIMPGGSCHASTVTEEEREVVEVSAVVNEYENAVLCSSRTANREAGAGLTSG